ncbi:MAG: ribosome biogenesis GTPase Der [Candidatus Marinimicrobia bacterium]|nr:ribosome biogenesis GTPase Der [Candidatus Neomarinimicrobiota bacterium]MBL7023635.1 ribosome biogenesis GTPase Der [Candidatus Neomarinimicrobiota bacterium]MBL7109822.1 ribosome biogenesis GTPase Der [Candidatus Neomarinimicrobiota bacterium]
MAEPTIAILGRPNVGKSTLFNRLVGKRHSIVSPVEGVTRDRVFGKFEWTGRKYNVIDTGGYLPDSEHQINKAVRLQAEIAVEESDLLILLVDGKQEITASDRYLAELIQKSKKPYLLVVNKIDDNVHEVSRYEFYELGLGEPISISSASGRNFGDFLDEISRILPTEQFKTDENLDAINLAIIGMPNVGKSSLMNALLQEEKSIVTEIAGTTRDSVDSFIKYYGKTIRLIDTAGLRRKAKVGDSIEYYSSVRTYRVLEECDIAVVMVDAQKGFDAQDKSIVRDVIDQGKGLILVVNKWDTIEKDTHTAKEYLNEIHYEYKSIEHYPVIFISIHQNQRVRKVLEVALNVYENRTRSVKTSEINEFVAMATSQYPPPAVNGKNLKIKYATQVHHAPPVVAFFTNFPELFPVTYKRYIENQFRKRFDFNGVPIKISFRKK